MNLRTRLLVILLLATSSAVAASEGSRGWPVFRGDPQLTGRATGDLPQQLELLWTFQAADGIESTAAIDSGRVYVTSMDGHLYVLELATGKLLWKHQASDSIKSSPAVHSGMVYYGDEGGVFHALDARTGEQRWTFHADAAIVSSANFTEGRVVFGSNDNYLYALTLKDGSLAWKVETGSYIYGTPAVVPSDQGDSVASAGCDGFMRLIRVRDGKVIKKIELQAYVGASPSVAGDRAYVGTFENQVLGLDLRAGKVLWAYENPERSFPFYSSAALGDDFLVVGGRDKMVHALSLADGSLRWKYSAGARVDASPVLVNQRVLAATTGGRLVALDVRSGKEVWTFESGTSFLGSPAVAAGRLVLGDTDGTVFCFGAPRGNAPQASKVEGP